MKPLTLGTSQRNGASGLAIRLIQLELPAEVCAVIKVEMEFAGLLRGLLCIGPSPIYPQSIFILWLPSDDESLTETLFGAALATPESAQLVFRALISKWRTAQVAFQSSLAEGPARI